MSRRSANGAGLDAALEERTKATPRDSSETAFDPPAPTVSRTSSRRHLPARSSETPEAFADGGSAVREPDAEPVPTKRQSPVRTADFIDRRAEPNDIQDPVIAPRGRNRAVLAAGELKPTAQNDPPASERSSNPAGAAIDVRKIESLVETGQSIAAHKLLSQWYWKFPDERSRFQKQLDELASSRYFSPRPHFEEAYEVQPGDQLRKVALKYHLSWQYLARLNNVDPRKVRAGQKLKVVQGPFSAVIDLSDYELTVHCHGFFVRKYRVGIGKDGSTPLGEFTVKEKLEDPTYYGPNGEVRANDDPQNPLGERWIDIGDGFGIHGTIEPDSIGRNESRGCIRMLNSDVEEVYDLLSIGSPVRIQR